MSSKKMPNMVEAMGAPGCAASTLMMAGAWAWAVRMGRAAGRKRRDRSARRAGLRIGSKGSKKTVSWTRGE
jgi:hypothetical protein